MLAQLLAWLNSLFAPQRYLVQYAQTPYGLPMPKPSMPSQTSSAGVEFVKREEGFKPKAYWDVKQWGIGYGHKIQPGDGLTSKSVINEDHATQLLKKDLGTAESAIRSSVKVPLTQNQFDALVSLIYNIGTGAFKSSDLLQHLNKGHYAIAANEFARWKFAGGKPILADRRARERALWGA